jgi:hypothetical protein
MPSHQVNKKRRHIVKRLWNQRCAFCGASAPLTIDHIQPQRLNGSDKIHNLRPLCEPCHRRLQPATFSRWFQACAHVFVDSQRIVREAPNHELTATKVCINCGGYSD